MTYSFRTNGNFIDFVHTDNTSLQVENVLKSLHNTSRCVDWSLPEDTTRITFTIDEVEFKNVLITEIDFDGTAMNSQDDFETGIIAAFPGLAGSGEEGGSSYLVYNGLMNGTTLPTIVPLGTPTISAVTITYDGATGFFYIASDDFVEGKTWFSISLTGGFNQSKNYYYGEVLFGEGGYPSKMIYITVETFNGINMQATNTFIDVPIKIRVYP